ncbi:MAG: hypothetical protein AAGC46_04475 [Solirubrobacteraceae bacterium]|nr:hypothetical protein [Patulibacter sp.]
MTYASPTSSLTMRPAGEGDTASIARVAALDSRPAPTGSVLLGLLDDRVVAALSIDDGHVVADPFVLTADVVSLLRARAAAIRLASGGTPLRRPRRARLSAALRG